MIRVAFGSTGNPNPEWIEFNCDLDEALRHIKKEHVKKIKCEFQLYTNYKHRFVVSNLYVGFDMWCLDDPSIPFSDMYAIYKALKIKEFDPAELSELEFRRYCEILCTQPGEYGDAYLQIQRLEPTGWVNLYKDD